MAETGSEFCGCLPTGCPLPELHPDEPNCTLPDIGNGGLGSGNGGNNGTLSSTITNLASSSLLQFTAAPDTQVTEFDTTVCCSANNAENEAFQHAQKCRKFCISGDICVTECVTYCEAGCASEASLGRAESQHVTNTVNGGNGGLGAGNGNCYNMTVCPQDVTIFNHGGAAQG